MNTTKSTIKFHSMDIVSALFHCHRRHHRSCHPCIRYHRCRCRHCRSDTITVSITVYNVYNFFLTTRVCVCASNSGLASKLKLVNDFQHCAIVENWRWYNEHSMYPVHSCALMHKHFQRVFCTQNAIRHHCVLNTFQSTQIYLSKTTPRQIHTHTHTEHTADVCEQ